MSYEFLKTNIDDRGVAFVTLSRPEIHNAFNDQLIKEITEAFKELEKNDKARLVVLSGEGKSFCAGADLNWMSSMIDYSMEENIADSRNLAQMFQTINNFSKPVIGKINGHALGGGVGVVVVVSSVVDVVFLGVVAGVVGNVVDTVASGCLFSCIRCPASPVLLKLLYGCG